MLNFKKRLYSALKNLNYTYYCSTFGKTVYNGIKIEGNNDYYSFYINYDLFKKENYILVGYLYKDYNEKLVVGLTNVLNARSKKLIKKMLKEIITETEESLKTKNISKKKIEKDSKKNFNEFIQRYYYV